MKTLRDILEYCYYTKWESMDDCYEAVSKEIEQLYEQRFKDHEILVNTILEELEREREKVKENDNKRISKKT